MSRFLSRSAFVVVAVASLLGLSRAAAAQEPFIGEIRCFGYNFVPRGWAALDGRLLPISQNTALFSLLGTQFGGDGVTTFALPDMRGRSLIEIGQGPGLSLNASVGQQGGVEKVTLTTQQLPAHSHTVTPLGSASDATLISPANAVPATKGRTTLYAPAPGGVLMAPILSSPAGGGQPVQTRSPYLAVTCAMALEGIYPARD
jgi:microcystin-dependent protein